MNARVFVLLLVSAAFVAVWDGDQLHTNQIRLAKGRSQAANSSGIPATVDLQQSSELTPHHQRSALAASRFDFGQTHMTTKLNAVDPDELDRHAAANHEHAPAHADVHSQTHAPSQSHESAVVVAENVAGEATETAVQPLIPLPKNLLPGTWLAMSHDGDSFRITIERTSSPKQSPNSKSDAPAVDTESRFCIVTGPDKIRWCFLKVQSPPAHQANRKATEFWSPINQ